MSFLVEIHSADLKAFARIFNAQLAKDPGQPGNILLKGFQVPVLYAVCLYLQVPGQIAEQCCFPVYNLRYFVFHV